MGLKRWSCVVLGVVCVFAGCSSSDDEEEPLENQPGIDSGTFDAGPVDGQLGDGMDVIERGICSKDLRTVLAEDGGVIQVCPDEQGCFEGKCVPACEAATKNKGNVGCDFVVATPSSHPAMRPACFALFVANSWTAPVKVTVTRGSETYDVTDFGRIAGTGSDATTWDTIPTTGVPPGKVAVLFMSDDPDSISGETPLACPVAPAIRQPGGTAVFGNQTIAGMGQSFHVTTDIPISAYDILPYGGANSFWPSAEMLLPTSAWGTNYVAVVPPKGTDFQNVQYGQIIASADATSIKVRPTVDLPGVGSIPPAPANKVTTIVLDQGQFFQWFPTGEMSGTVIEADKPVSFVGGHGYLCLKSSTSEGGGCDTAHQMVPPVSALGHEYVVAPYKTRRPDDGAEALLYRIVGLVDGTTLTFDPPQTGVATTLGLGARIDFEATGPFTVKSQDKEHPIYVAQMMTGCQVPSGELGDKCWGDEEWVNVFPPAQYLSKYVFFTDPTYPTTNLVFVRSKVGGVDGAFKDVTLDCAGKLGGWTSVGGSNYEMTTVDLVRSGIPNGSCNNGPHVAESEAPFGLVVWGIAAASSYAYPAGGTVAPINKVVVDPVPN